MGVVVLAGHLRTYPAPRHWPVAVKESAFTVRPMPGPHPFKECIPLGLILRDVLGKVKTISEAKRALAERKVLVDGKVRRDYRYPVGLMDILYLKPEEVYYRVMPDRVRKLCLMRISPDEATFKLLKIKGKHILKGRKVQLSFHDGKTLAFNVDDPFNIQLPYAPNDVLKISIADNQVLDHLPLDRGVFVAVTGGRNVGQYGTVVETPQTKSPDALSKVSIAGKETTVTLKYLFPIGKESPIISTSGEVA
ncbi:MAG: 30S ribosomal protein S4e [Candidatus Verstraetearchaeota archaeon]|nr:30S ribosomal protein S4e [Candidatus Verstraetearchaeota archaeon]